MPPDRPRLLLVESDVARRLEWTSLLSPRWDVLPVSLDDDPLRHARARAPAAAVLGMERKTSERVLRLCRGLRTDLRVVPQVGVYELGSPRRGAWIAMELWMATGYLEAPAPAEVVVDWVDALLRGERPVVVAPRGEGGRLDRLRALLRRP